MSTGDKKMPRNRMIKAEYWTSEQVLSCSIPSRLLFIGLWNFCDDNGVHQASYVRLKAEVFPIDSFTLDEIKKWIGELIANGLLREYAVNEKTYWIVTGWKQHQKIDKPTYRHPLPESDLKMLPNIRQTLDEDSGTNISIVVDNSAKSIPPLATKEKETKEKVKEKHLGEAKATRCDFSSDFENIFSYWKEKLQHPHAKLDKKRKSKIAEALKLGYSIDQLKQAIDGCSQTPFNMGKNERNQRYDDLELILRDAAHIDRFIENANSLPGVSKEDRQYQDVFSGAI